MNIRSDKPLQSTCCVCGEPLGLLAGVPNPLGNAKCKICGGTPCGSHFNLMTKVCSSCSDQPSDWCKTPGPPKLPPLF